MRMAGTKSDVRLGLSEGGGGGRREEGCQMPSVSKDLAPSGPSGEWQWLSGQVGEWRHGANGRSGQNSWGTRQRQFRLERLELRAKHHRGLRSAARILSDSQIPD